MDDRWDVDVVEGVVVDVDRREIFRDKKGKVDCHDIMQHLQGTLCILILIVKVRNVYILLKNSKWHKMTSLYYR